MIGSSRFLSLLSSVFFSGDHKRHHEIYTSRGFKLYFAKFDRQRMLPADNTYLFEVLKEDFLS